MSTRKPVWLTDDECSVIDDALIQIIDDYPEVAADKRHEAETWPSDARGLLAEADAYDRECALAEDIRSRLKAAPEAWHTTSPDGRRWQIVHPDIVDPRPPDTPLDQQPLHARLVPLDVDSGGRPVDRGRGGEGSGT